MKVAEYNFYSSMDLSEVGGYGQKFFCNTIVFQYTPTIEAWTTNEIESERRYVQCCVPEILCTRKLNNVALSV